jgi:hypothetical protein
MVVDLEHPRRALRVAAFARPDDLAGDEVFEELPHDVAVSAQHHVPERAVAQELAEALEAASLLERRRVFDLDPARASERLDGLDTS